MEEQTLAPLATSGTAEVQNFIITGGATSEEPSLIDFVDIAPPTIDDVVPEMRLMEGRRFRVLDDRLFVVDLGSPPTTVDRS